MISYTLTCSPSWQGKTWLVGVKVLLIPSHCMGHPSGGQIQRPGVETSVKSRGLLCAMCVMKGAYWAGSPSLHGWSEMLLEGGLTCVGIT